MIRTNWHTHTARCGHATGSDEEIVQAAIDANFVTLGFSDHAPYKDPHPTDRMNMSEYPGYVESIHSLKEKYKDVLNIYCGMEVEYYPSQWEDLSKYRKELDYCILGQHALSYEGQSSYHFTTPEELNLYTDAIEEACKRNFCDYVAHPDVCMYRYPCIDEAVHEVAHRLADISLKYGVPMELNMGSVRRGLKKYEDGERYAYPTRAFFTVFAEKKVPIVIGLDVHSPSHLTNTSYFDQGMEVVKGLDLNILTDYDLVAAAKKRKELFQ